MTLQPRLKRLFADGIAVAVRSSVRTPTIFAQQALPEGAIPTDQKSHPMLFARRNPENFRILHDHSNGIHYASPPHVG
jgi:hypothetical protein